MKTLSTLALVMLLAVPVAAQAQRVGRAESYSPEEQWMLAEHQLIKALQSPIDDVRAQSLKNAIVFAALYRDKIDLYEAVDAIREVYEADVRTVNRKLALAALQAIGSRRTAQYVARHATAEEAEESRALVASVLNEVYQTRTSVRLQTGTGTR